MVCELCLMLVTFQRFSDPLRGYVRRIQRAHPFPCAKVDEGEERGGQRQRKTAITKGWFPSLMVCCRPCKRIVARDAPVGGTLFRKEVTLRTLPLTSNHRNRTGRGKHHSLDHSCVRLCIRIGYDMQLCKSSCLAYTMMQYGERSAMQDNAVRFHNT